MEYINYHRCNGLHLGDESQNRELALWKVMSIDLHFQIYKIYCTMFVNTISMIYCHF